MPKATHPEARQASIATRVEARNAKIRERCAMPGFGYLILLCRANGSRHMRDAPTYEMAVDIRDHEMANGDFEKCWIIQKRWDAAMSITSDPRDREATHDRWMRADQDDDL